MSVLQFSGAFQQPGQAVVATLDSSIPLNMSGQVITGSPGVVPQPSVFTVGGWIRLVTNGIQTTVFSAAGQFELNLTNQGFLCAQFIEGSGVTSDIAIQDTDWHFVACTFLQDPDHASTGVLSLYLDGSATATGLVTGSSATATSDWSLGVGDRGLEVVSWCLWSTPLSGEEVDAPFWGEPAGGISQDGLLAAYDFAGGTAVDVGGNGYAVTASALMWHTPCLQLSQATLTAAASDGLAPGGPEPFSMLVWADVDQGYQPIVSSGSQGAGVEIVLEDGQVSAYWGNGITLTHAVTPGWHHIGLVFDGTTGNLYLDGSIVETTGAPSLPAVTPNFVVGGSLATSQTGSIYLQGLSVWTTALTQAQVQDYMTGDAPFGVAGCVGFFPFTDIGEDALANTVTFAPMTSNGQAIVFDLETVVGQSELAQASGQAAARVTAYAAHGDAASALADEAGRLLRFTDLKRMAQALPESAMPAVDDPLVTSAVQWYEGFLTTLPTELADRLRAEFTDNLRLGMAHADSGSKAGRFELRTEGDQTVTYYHGAQGPVEVGRMEGTLSPYLMWVVTIFIDIASIFAAMFGILTTAAKVTKAVGLFDDLYPGIGAAAANVPANATATQRATTAIWNVLQFLWEWKSIGTLIWNIIKASWWSVAFTVASLVAQVAALIATGGWLIAVKVAQMAIAIGNLVKDLLLMPTSDTSNGMSDGPATGPAAGLAAG